MFKKTLLVILAVEVFLYISYKPNKKINLEHVINIKHNNSNVDKVKLERYVIGVVAAEMPATFSFEALKAQAVASRTFIYEKLNNGNISYDNLKYDQGQAYITKDDMKKKWKEEYNNYYEKIKSAVMDTKGEIILYNGKPIKAYYFSTSNGSTENSKMVFGEEEYLVSVDTSFDKESKEYLNEAEYSVNDILTKLGINDNKILIDNIKKSQSNHIDSIMINGKNFSGLEIRKMLGLRSTDFDIVVNGNTVSIITRGYGHGVGMSQYGANYLANNGKNYKEIINYFYKDVSIDKI